MTLLPVCKRLYWTKCLVWTIGTGLLTTLTIISFLPVLDEYRYNNVDTQIGVVKTGTIQKPNLTVCFPYFSGALGRISKWLASDPKTPEGSSDCIECQAMKEHGWDIWTHPRWGPHQNRTISDCDRNVDPECIKNELMGALVKELVLKEESLAFTPGNFNWNEAIADAVFLFFSCTTRHDLNFTIQPSDARPLRCDGFDFSLPSRTMDLLYRRLLDYMSLYLKIAVVTEDGRVFPETLEDRKGVMTVKGHFFCMALHVESKSETFQLIPFEGSMAPPWIRSVRPDLHYVFGDHDVLYSQVRGYQVVYPNGRRVSNRKPRSYESVTLAYALETRVSETRLSSTCRKDPASDGVCVAQRQLPKVVEACGCVPFLHRKWSLDHSHLPYCNASLYLQCHGGLRDAYRANEAYCKNTCEHNVYKWSTIGRTKKVVSQKWTFQINISSQSSPYLEFRITNKDTPEQFLSQLGGLVNLYLGFSGASICALIIICIEQIKRYRRSKSGVKRKYGTSSPMGISSVTGSTVVDMLDMEASHGGYLTKRETMEAIQEMKAEVLSVLEQRTDRVCAS